MIQIRTQPRHTGETNEDELRGIVEHVGTGRRQPFTSAPQLLAFLRADNRGLPEVEE